MSKDDRDQNNDDLRRPLASDEDQGEPEGGTEFEVTEFQPEGYQAASILDYDIFGRVFPKEVVTFSRQLATLIDVGIPLLKSLKILSARTSNPKLRKIIADIAKTVEEGGTLSGAMAKYPKVFSGLFISMIRIGEVGGVLDISLRRLADIMEKRQSLARKVRSALMYPAVAVSTGIAVVIFLLAYVIPKFVNVYREQDVELPTPTKVIIGIGNFMSNNGVFCLIIAIVAMIALYLYSQSKPGRYTFDWLKLKFPIVGGLISKVLVARFTATFATLLKAGVPLLEGIRITRDTMGNTVMAKTLDKAAEYVESGERIDESLRGSAAFPDLVVDMIAIGNEAGALDVVLDKVSEAYEDEVETSISGLTAIIEPLLIVVLGGIVAFIALAMFLPYFNMVNVI